MKNSKKLLILLLSLVLLIGAFVTVAAAEGSEKVSVSYPDGTVVEYAVGETIVAPAGDTYAGKNGTLYKDDATAGWSFTLEGVALTDLTVTEAMLGKTVVASGYDKVYFTVAVTGGETTYYTDAANAGANFKTYMQKMNKAGSTITLYADIETAGLKAKGPGKQYLDLNGHKLTFTSVYAKDAANALDVAATGLYIYSSQPGGLIDASATPTFMRCDDESDYDGTKRWGTLYIGEKSDTDTSNGKNLTVYCQSVNAKMYGSYLCIYGGTYVQSSNSTQTRMLVMSRDGATTEQYGSHVQNVKNATFVVTKAGTGVVFYRSSEARTFTGCTFVNASGGKASLFTGSKVTSSGTSNTYATPKAATFVNCNIYDLTAGPEYAYDFEHKNTTTSTTLTGTISVKMNYTNCLFGGVAPTVPAGSFLVHGVAQTITANGVSYDLDMSFVKDVSQAYGINWGGFYTDYWLVGATPYCAADMSTFREYYVSGGSAFVRYDASFDASIFTPVMEAQIGTVLDAVPTYASSADIAFRWKKEDGSEGFVIKTEGMTAAEIGQAFYDKFDKADAPYEIILHADLLLPAAMGWGPVGVINTNVPEYHSLKNGSITLDLNGFTFSIPALTEGINVSNSNDLGSYPHSSEAIFGFEFDVGVAKTFKLKSSRPGAKIINESSLALFAVGEGARLSLVIDGENLTYIGKGAVSHAYEVVNNGGTSLTVNGGLYIIESNRPAFSFVEKVTIKNAEIVMRGNAPVAIFAAHSYKRDTAFTVENCVISSVNAVPLFSVVGTAYAASNPNASSTAYSLTLKDCYLLGGVNVVSSITNLDSLVYQGLNFSDTEAKAEVMGSGVVGKLHTELSIAGGAAEAVTLYACAAESAFVKVVYGNVAETEYFALGSFFRPVSAQTLVQPYFKLDEGVFVDVLGYKDQMAADVVSEEMIGRALNASSYIIYEESDLAFVVLVGDAAVDYEFLATAEYEQALLDAILAAGENSVVRIYVDVTAPDAIENTASVILDLYGNTLYLADAVKANAPITVMNGNVVLTAQLTCLFDGEATVEEVNLYNIFDPAALTSDAATVKNSKVFGFTLASVTAEGTVFHTDAAFTAPAQTVYNNGNETLLTVGDEEYAIAYPFVVTDDASKICTVAFLYKDALRASKLYYAGSVPAYSEEIVEGYVISYAGNEKVYADAELECVFTAEASKLQAKIVITERLNYVFYLEKQDCLSNLVFAGIALDINALDVELIDGKEYIVLPYQFASIANSMDSISLSVDVAYGQGEVERVVVTVSLLDYAAAILGDGTAKLADKQLAYALLAYVDAMMDYFAKPENADLSAALEAYAEYRTAFVAPEAEKISSDYVHGALFIVNENLDLALRVDPDFKGELIVSFPDGSYKTYTYQDITWLDGYSYIVVADVSFADAGVGLDIAVKMYGVEVEGEGFTYSIANYAQAMTVQNMGYTPVYAKALYTFVSLAARSNG